MIKQKEEISDFEGLRNERLHSLFNTMSLGVIYYDEFQQVIDVNPAALEILGIERSRIRQEVEYDPEWKTIREDGSEFRREDYPRRVAFRTGKPVPSQIIGVFNLKEKKYRWLQIEASPEFKPNSKKPYQVRTTFEDITAKRTSEKLLQKQSEYTLKLTQNHPSGIVACNAQGELILFNNKAKQWHGIDILDIPQSHWAEYYSLHDPDTGELLDMNKIPLVMAYQGKRVEQIEIVIKSIDQVNRHVLCNAASMRDDQGNIIGALCIMNDITYQRNQEKKLKNQEKELRFKLEQVSQSKFFLKEIAKIAKVGGWIMNTQTDELNWTEEIYNIHGLPIGDKPPLDEALDFYRDGAREIVSQTIQDSITHKRKFDYQLPFQNLQKEKLWVRAIGHPILDEKDNLVGLKGIFQDITDIRNMRDIMEKQQEMYNLLANNIVDIISIFDLGGVFRFITPSVWKILGYDQSEIIGVKFDDFVHREDLDGLKEFLSKEVRIGGSEKSYDVRIMHKDGHYLWLEILSSQIYKDGKLDTIVTSARDITDAVLANKKVARYQKALQKLTNEIVNVEEMAKRRIASNIHDHLSQALVMAKMKIDKILKEKGLHSMEDLMFIKTQVTNALDNSRKITTELSPQVLYQLGIVEALHWLIENYQETYEMKFELQANLYKVELSDSSAIILYRCVQELLNNAIKHSEASKVIIQISRKNSDIIVHVIDNGNGFNPDKLDAIYNLSDGGYGLFSISERLGNVGGEFVIQSQLSQGTDMKIKMPIS